MTKKLYEGTKRLYATPMNRGDYNAYRGWEVPSDEDPADEGYLVEYLDGGKSNHPDHAGYISWSPKSVFERAYKPILEPHQQRVVDEKAELDARLSKLTALVCSENFASIVPGKAERTRLITQEGFMQQYSDILAARIAAF